MNVGEQERMPCNAIYWPNIKWGGGLPLSALSSLYFPVKIEHPITLIHLKVLLEGTRLQVSLVERKERGKLPLLMNTNRKSEIDYGDYNSGLWPPSATQDQPSAGPCRSFCLLPISSQERVFKQRVQVTCRGGKGQDPCGICVSGRDTQKGSGSEPLAFAWSRAAPPTCLFSSPFHSSLSALPHHDLIFRLFPSFCILFLLIFFLQDLVLLHFPFLQRSTELCHNYLSCNA